MKIGVIDNLHLGGAKRVVYEQIKELSKKHDVFWATNTMYEEFDARKYCQNFVELSFRPLDGSSLLRPLYEWQQYLLWRKNYHQANSFFESVGVQVIVAHPDLITQAPLILSISSIPTVYYAEEWYRSWYEPELHPILGGNLITRQYERIRRRALHTMDKSSTRASDVVAVNSQFQKGNFKQAYAVDSRVVYPGVDIDVFRPKTDALGDHFLFVGSKSEIEGYDLIDKIEKQSSFTIKKVLFSQHDFAISDASLAEEYSQALGVLCFSKNEPFGMIPLEAMACQTPVIAINEGGYTETVLDGETGFLVQADVEDILKAMFKLTDIGKRRSMGIKARNHVNKSFTWSEHIRLLESILFELG